MFWELAALFRFSFQLAIPEVKKRKWCLTNSTKKNTNLGPGHLLNLKKKKLIWWAIELENLKWTIQTSKTRISRQSPSVGWSGPGPSVRAKESGIKIKKKGCFCWTELTRNGSGWFSFIFCIMKKNEPNKKKYKNKFGVFGSLLI